jgi:predicted NUDIX family NTP pyrophosphohydrolase
MAKEGAFKRFSQLLWPDKDREEWFSLGENHEKVLGSDRPQLRNLCSALNPPIELSNINCDLALRLIAAKRR